jgi:hypothetical protein
MAQKKVPDQEAVRLDSELKQLESVVKSLIADLSESCWPDLQIEVQMGNSRISIRFSGRSIESEKDLMVATGKGYSLLNATGSDLKQGDKVPSKPEVDVVGAFVKRINRNDPEFATLVSNTNSKIVFKDEEGTGADRMMTQKLKVGLDALAVLVASEWAGVKLRVTEAWDEDGEHSPKSLHYEGRAADLTTAPIDGAKLGRLARLAVDAGLTWVFFEDSAHIHVSVPT